MNSDLLSNN